jgi:hypothetical protein
VQINDKISKGESKGKVRYPSVLVVVVVQPQICSMHPHPHQRPFAAAAAAVFEMAERRRQSTRGGQAHLARNASDRMGEWSKEGRREGSLEGYQHGSLVGRCKTRDAKMIMIVDDC